jgi:hypothetical protein
MNQVPSNLILDLYPWLAKIFIATDEKKARSSRGDSSPEQVGSERSGSRASSEPSQVFELVGATSLAALACELHKINQTTQ